LGLNRLCWQLNGLKGLLGHFRIYRALTNRWQQWALRAHIELPPKS
jgi:hypothetical protein